MYPYIGEIRLIAFNYPPPGWAFCNGQLLSISSNSALFALLGTTYGGDERTTFGLPNLQSRVPIHQGTGPGLSPYVWGQAGGTENVTLTTAQIPQHNHTFAVTIDAIPGTTPDPTGGGNIAQVQIGGSSAPSDSFTTGQPSNPVTLNA